MSSLRIGIFHPTIDMYGGAEVVAVIAANTLVKNNFDVRLFANNILEQERIKSMIGEALSPLISISINPFYFLRPRATLHVYESAARSLVFKNQCDILIDTYSCCVFPWTDVVYFHFPYINNYDFKQSLPYLRNPRVKFAIAIPYLVYEKNLEVYDDKMLLANSFFTAQAIRESLGVDSEVLYPPIPDPFFEGALPPDRDDIVVTVARFGPNKGVELVPKIAALTSKDIKFFLIGLAHDRTIVEYIRRYIKKHELEDRVKIVLDAPRDYIKNILGRAKVYLHTTEMEHFGISIVESMARGCLPIVHDSGGAKEFVPDKYRYDGFEDAAVKISSAMDEWDHAKSSSMRKSAKRFSQSQFAEELTRLFNDYVERNVF